VRSAVANAPNGAIYKVFVIVSSFFQPADLDLQASFRKVRCRLWFDGTKAG
jgi:hypothetical protein